MQQFETFTLGPSSQNVDVLYVQYASSLGLTASFNLFETSTPNGSPLAPVASLLAGVLDFSALSEVPAGGVIEIRFDSLLLGANQSYSLSFNTSGGTESFVWRAAPAAGANFAGGRYAEPGNTAEGFALGLVNDGGFGIGIGIGIGIVPEPSTYALMLIGLLALAVVGYRRQRQPASNRVLYWTQALARNLVRGRNNPGRLRIYA